MATSNNSNALWTKMSLAYIEAYRKASGSDHAEMYEAEFDDALTHQAHWKNPRWAGCKLTGRRINEYNGTDPFIDQINTSSADYLAKMIPSSSTETVWGGDISYGLNPVINRETTAIYIANTLVGGTENTASYASLEGHSYVGINKILVVNMEDNTVKVLDRETEDYDSFHRFLTQDFPTGTQMNIKVLDPAIQSNLEGSYFARMNKGWLLSTFKYLTYNNDNTTVGLPGAPPANELVGYTQYDSPLELFDQSDMGDTNNNVIDGLISIDTPRLCFRFGYKSNDTTQFQGFPDGFYGGGGLGSSDFGAGAPASVTIAARDFSPNYSKATIESNKFTKQYYTGSNVFPEINTGGDGAFFSASRFILNDTLGFLNKNFDQTELHLTINKGTLDFAPGFNDERSMGTFEVDKSFGQLAAISINDETDGFIGTSHDGTPAFQSTTFTGPGDFVGHHTPYHHILQLKGTPPFSPLGNGVTRTEPHVVLVENGGDSQAARMPHTRQTYWNGDENPRVLQYSGSAAFELSFLDKDHTLIVNIDKPNELFQGIGTKGIALIPEHLHGDVKNNLEYYLKQAGIIDASTTFQATK